MAAQFGTRVHEARVKAGLSLRDVASAAKISPSSLSQIENGRWVPALGKALALQGALGLRSIEELLGKSPAHPSEGHARRYVPHPPKPKNLPGS